MIIENYFINGNASRVFLNTNLGCSSVCSYCYLPELDLKVGTKKKNKMAIDHLINALENSDFFVPGKHGSILSIGCYSECWDSANVRDTIELLLKLIPYKNPIQLSTKRQIVKSDLDPVLAKIIWEGQLSIYISNSTISHWKEYEQKTCDPKNRFRSFEISKLQNIPMYLYIKPVLPGITIKDLNKYIKIIEEYNINVIIGEMFTSTRSAIKAPIGNNRLFYDNSKDRNTQEFEILYNELSKYANVYYSSVDPICTRRGSLQ